MSRDVNFGTDVVLWSPADNAGDNVCWQDDVVTDVAAFWMFFKVCSSVNFRLINLIKKMFQHTPVVQMAN